MDEVILLSNRKKTMISSTNASHLKLSKLGAIGSAES